MSNKTNDEMPVGATAQTIKRRLFLIAAVFAPLLVSNFVVGTALATPGSGVTSTTIAGGTLPAPIRVKLAERHRHEPGKPGAPSELIALSLNSATTYAMDDERGFGDGIDVSNISIVKNVIAPGGYFGWHQHSGPSWIVVTQGTLTFYNADDPTCTGHRVEAGNAYLDMGNHTHNARNETDAPVENYVVRMLPAGGAVRIDMPDPGVCPF